MDYKSRSIYTNLSISDAREWQWDGILLSLVFFETCGVPMFSYYKKLSSATWTFGSIQQGSFGLQYGKSAGLQGLFCHAMSLVHQQFQRSYQIHMDNQGIKIKPKICIFNIQITSKFIFSRELQEMKIVLIFTILCCKTIKFLVDNYLMYNHEITSL